MKESAVVDTLRERRIAAGLSQRELAARSGVPQPNISAYERGRRVPEPSTLDRLGAAIGSPTLERLRGVRELILELADRRGLSDIRVFGSVARGDTSPDSDVDLLVHPSPTSSIFDLAGFMAEVEDLLGVPVDVVSDRGSGPVMERIRTEAIAL